MKRYRKTSHSVYDLKFHFVWITKYRKPVLLGDVAIRVRDLIREICNSMDIEIIKGHVSKDHVHLFASVPPYHSVSDVMKRVKGKTSHKLLSENRMLAKKFWGCHLKTEGSRLHSSLTVKNEDATPLFSFAGDTNRTFNLHIPF